MNSKPENAKLRIGIYLNSEPHDGGVFQYSRSMLAALVHLAEDSIDPVVVYGKFFWGNMIDATGVEAYYLPPSRRERAIGWLVRKGLLPVKTVRSMSRFFHPTIRFLKKRECDLWIFPSQNPVSYHGEIPALVSVLDLMHRYEPRFPEVSARGQYEWRELNYGGITRWATGILVDSEVGKRQVIESYAVPPEKIFVLPYVPPAPLMQDEGGFDERYKLPRKFIFYPAQFWQHKNHRNLILAVNELKNRLSEIFLVLVGGKKNEYENIVRLISDLDLASHVTIFDYVPDNDLGEFYRRAVAMVMPTFFGPTNIPPLEAFVYKCPCAVSAIYGMPEQVGGAALLFDPTDPRDIAHVIERLWLDEGLRRDLIREGLNRAAQWTQSLFSARVLEIVRCLASSRRVRLTS